MKENFFLLEKKNNLSKDINASLYCSILYKDDKGHFNCIFYPDLNKIIKDRKEKEIFNIVKKEKRVVIYDISSSKPIIEGRWYDSHIDEKNNKLYIGIDKNRNGKLEKGEILHIFDIHTENSNKKYFYFLGEKIPLRKGNPKNLIILYNDEGYNIIDYKFVNDILKRAGINYKLKKEKFHLSLVFTQKIWTKNIFISL